MVYSVMPTDNPKISLYVPQQVYDRFKEFQEKRELSMSHAGIVILAEYFGIEETIKEITEGTTVGGVTLARVEKLEKEIQELRGLVNQKSNTSSLPTSNIEDQTKTTGELPKTAKQNISTEEPVSSSSEVDHKNTDGSSLRISSEPQFVLSGLPGISPMSGLQLSEKRLGLGKSTLGAYKAKHTLEELTAWTKEKDPDDIAWIYSTKSKGYLPSEKTPSELLSKLKKWFEENI